MKLNLVVVGVMACAVMCLPRAVRANSLLLESITTTRLFPDTSTIYPDPADGIPGFTTVTAQAGADSGQASPQPTLYSIDFETSNIYFDFLASSGFGGTAVIFDGLKFSGIGPTISGVSVNAVSGISVESLYLSGNDIFLNLNGNFTRDASLDIQVDFRENVPVPEPATVSLLTLGLMSAGAHRRLRRRGRQ